VIKINDGKVNCACLMYIARDTDGLMSLTFLLDIYNHILDWMENKIISAKCVPYIYV